MTQMIETTKGPMDKADLVQVLGHKEDDVEATHWVEYYFHDELVHRSVHVHLKLGTESTVTGNIFA